MGFITTENITMSYPDTHCSCYIYLHLLNFMVDVGKYIPAPLSVTYRNICGFRSLFFQPSWSRKNLRCNWKTRKNWPEPQGSFLVEFSRWETWELCDLTPSSGSFVQKGRSSSRPQTQWGSRLWLQTCLFSTLLGDMVQFDEHIFPMGWNHQLAIHVSANIPTRPNEEWGTWWIDLWSILGGSSQDLVQWFITMAIVRSPKDRAVPWKRNEPSCISCKQGWS